jgi:hypothetical protein
LITATDIFAISSQKQFENSLKVFRYQHENNLVYREFCGPNESGVVKIKNTPTDSVLPIQFFKSHAVVSNTNPKIHLLAAEQSD